MELSTEQVGKIADLLADQDLDTQKFALNQLAKEKIRVRGVTLTGYKNPPRPGPTEPKVVKASSQVPGIVQYPKDAQLPAESVGTPPEKPAVDYASLYGELGEDYLKTAVAIPDVALNLATGAVGQVAGVAAGAPAFALGEPTVARNIMEKVSSKLTWEPKTEYGAKATKAVFDPVSKLITGVSKSIADASIPTSLPGQPYTSKRISDMFPGAEAAVEYATQAAMVVAPTAKGLKGRILSTADATAAFKDTLATTIKDQHGIIGDLADRFTDEAAKTFARAYESQHKGIVQYTKDVKVQTLQEINNGKGGIVRWAYYHPGTKEIHLPISQTLPERLKDIAKGHFPKGVSPEKQIELTSHEYAHAYQEFIPSLEHVNSILDTAEANDIQFKNADNIRANWGKVPYGKTYATEIDSAQTNLRRYQTLFEKATNPEAKKEYQKRIALQQNNIKEYQHLDKLAKLSTQAAEDFSDTLERLSSPEQVLVLGDLVKDIENLSPRQYKALSDLRETYGTKDLGALDYNIEQFGSEKDKKVFAEIKDAKSLPESSKTRDTIEQNALIGESLLNYTAFRDAKTGEIIQGEKAWTRAKTATAKGLPHDPNIQDGFYINGKFYNSATNAAEALKNLTTTDAAKRLLTGEGGFLNLQVVKDFYNNIRDKITIDAVPKLTRIGAFATTRDHAAAKYAVNPIADDFIGRLSINGKDVPGPELSEKFVKYKNADRILGGYDEFRNMADRERQAGNASVAGRWDAQASRIAQKHGLARLESIVDGGQRDPEIMALQKNWHDKVAGRVQTLPNGTKNPYYDNSLTAWFNEELGFDSDTPREGKGRHSDDYWPLVTKDKEEQWHQFMKDEDQPLPDPSQAHHMNPHMHYDPHTHAAHYTGDYSTDLNVIMRSTVASRYENVTRWRMYKDLIDKGAAVWAEGIPRPALLNGKEVVPFRAKVPEVNPKTGTSRYVEKTMYLQKDLLPELTRVLNTDLGVTQSKIANAMTNVQIFQGADAITHTKNELSVLSTAQGAGSVWQDLLRQLPIFGTADGAVRLAEVLHEVQQDTPAIRAEIADMSKKGLLRQHYPSKGFQAITHIQEGLYRGELGVRIIMNRFFDHLVQMGKAVDSELNRFNFVNQCGMYNSRLMSGAMAWMKRKGWAPFVVAGRNFNRQMGRRLLGSPGVEATDTITALKMRAVHLAGIAATLTIPMMLNTMTTGSPSGRPGTPFGAWDLGGKPDEKGKFKTFDLFQWTGVRRGARRFGIEAIVEGLHQGHTTSQIAGKAVTDAMSTAAHPWTGPIVSTVGKAAPIMSPAMGQYVYGATTEDHVENFRKAAENVNPVAYAVARPVLQKIGMDKEPDLPGKYAYPKDVATKLFLKSPFQAFGIKDVAPAQSGAEKAAHDIISGHFHSVMDKTDKERFAAESALINSIRTGSMSDASRDVIKAAVEKGLITDKTLERVSKKGGITQLESYLDRLNSKETAKVFVAAKQTNNQKDMALILPHLVDKLSSADDVTQKEVFEMLGRHFKK